MVIEYLNPVKHDREHNTIQYLNLLQTFSGFLIWQIGGFDEDHQ